MTELPAFPKTHSIGELLKLVQQSGIEVPPEMIEAERLTQFAVEARYPTTTHISDDDCRQAIEPAERVVRWAERLI